MDPEKFFMDHARGFAIGFLLCTFSMLLLHYSYYSQLGIKGKKQSVQRYCKLRFISYGLSSLFLFITSVIANDTQNGLFVFQTTKV